MKIYTVTEFEREDTNYLRSPEDGIWEVGFGTKEAAMRQVDTAIDAIMGTQLPWEKKPDVPTEWVGDRGHYMRTLGVIEWHVTEVEVW